MADKTLADLAKAMKDIDFTMLSTRASNDAIASRPMSNNRDVDYDGDSYYFTEDSTDMVSDIGRDAKVGLSFQAKSGLLGLRPLFIHVEGTADLVRDKAQFAEHWTSDLDRWFEQGVDTPGLVMIHVRASRIHYWDGMEEGELRV